MAALFYGVIISLGIIICIMVPLGLLWHGLHFAVSRRRPTIITDTITLIGWTVTSLWSIGKCIYQKGELGFLDQLFLILSTGAIIAIMRARNIKTTTPSRSLFYNLPVHSLFGPVLLLGLSLWTSQWISNQLLLACDRADIPSVKLWRICGANLPTTWDTQSPSSTHDNYLSRMVSSIIDDEIQNDRAPVVHAYLEAGADTKGRLIVAVQFSRHAIAQDLIAHGADAYDTYSNEVSYEVQTPLQLARSRGDLKMITLLEAAGRK